MKNSRPMDRRHFLTAGAASTLAVSLAPSLQAEVSSTNSAKNTVKFSLFADIHHAPGSFFSNAPKRLTQIQERAIREKCDFIIHCGDFCHNPKKETGFVKQFNDFQIPGYHVLGNHDFDGCSDEETFKAYRLQKNYYFFDRNGFRFVALDANYFRNEDGTFTHYSNGNYFKYRGNAISVIPPEQVAWLAETLENSPYPCVLFSHQSVEREGKSIKNWEEIRNLIDSVNARHPGRIRMCVNGHHHRDFIRILNQVIYFDLNSTTHEWLSKRHDLFPKEITEKYPMANHTVIFEDPVHAIVTMDSEGLIKIEGMKSQMFLGITPEKAGCVSADSSGRPVSPTVQSLETRFTYR
ncbi:MAG: metallophosphoesterase [Thermoguttaceae bacterium]|nr:metallophosphoesterase [Thermoguttaceae bacterium]